MCGMDLVITSVMPTRDVAGRRDLHVEVVVTDCTSDEEVERWRALVGRRVMVTPV